MQLVPKTASGVLALPELSTRGRCCLPLLTQQRARWLVIKFCQASRSVRSVRTKSHWLLQNRFRTRTTHVQINEFTIYFFFLFPATYERKRSVRPGKEAGFRRALTLRTTKFKVLLRYLICEPDSSRFFPSDFKMRQSLYRKKILHAAVRPSTKRNEF